MKWYSDMTTMSLGSTLLPTRDRFFRATSRKATELDCIRTDLCRDGMVRSLWGPKFVVELDIQRSTGVVVYNATQFGIFWWNGHIIQNLRSVYDWPTAISNVSLTLLIVRWSVSLMALHRGYLEGKSRLHHTGIGTLSNSASFQFLPILLLPRLSTTLAAFFSIRCSFQGQQSALAETWFVMYPAIAELVLVYYSLLNTLAKILRRRVTDMLFAPTILVLSALHFFRWELRSLQWLDVPEGTIATLVTSDEMMQLQLDQFFTSVIALRLNGGITPLFIAKLAVLGLSLVPLLATRPLKVYPSASKSLTGVEKVLAVRVSNVGGLGRSPCTSFEPTRPPPTWSSLGAASSRAVLVERSKATSCSAWASSSTATGS